MIGNLLDRLVFWNMPSFLKSYVLPIPHRIIVHHGIEVWFIPGKIDGPTVLFCHGNAGNLRFPKARRNRFLALHNAGANLWVFDYRGYGHSHGAPSEEGAYRDAKMVHSLAREHHNKDLPFVLFGRSLGGAVATYLATEVQTPDFMILESTFTSAPEVCANWTHDKLSSFMSYGFNNRERIKQLQCPLYMIHGTKDWIVKYKFGQQVFQACPQGREFVTIPGAGHNNLQEIAGDLYEETLSRWLQAK